MPHTAYTLSRPQKLFVVCAAVFLTALVVAEATASKFFTAFELPFTLTLFNYAYKFVIAVAVTPLIYAAHWGMDVYLGDAAAEALTEAAARGEETIQT